MAKDETGRRAINRIVTAGYKIETYSKYKKVTWEQLKEDSEGLMMISGGQNGAIEKAILDDDMELAKKRLSLFENIFAKEDIYLQVQRVENTVSGQENEEKIINGFKELEKK